MARYYIVRGENGNLTPVSGPFESWAEADEHYDDLIQGNGDFPPWIMWDDDLRLRALLQGDWFEVA